MVETPSESLAEAKSAAELMMYSTPVAKRPPATPMQQIEEEIAKMERLKMTRLENEKRASHEMREEKAQSAKKQRLLDEEARADLAKQKAEDAKLEDERIARISGQHQLQLQQQKLDQKAEKAKHEKELREHADQKELERLRQLEATILAEEKAEEARRDKEIREQADLKELDRMRQLDASMLAEQRAQEAKCDKELRDQSEKKEPECMSQPADAARLAQQHADDLARAGHLEAAKLSEQQAADASRDKKDRSEMLSLICIACDKWCNHIMFTYAYIYICISIYK